MLPWHVSKLQKMPKWLKLEMDKILFQKQYLTFVLEKGLKKMKQ